MCKKRLDGAEKTSWSIV